MYGFQDARLVEDRALTISDENAARRAGSVRFYSATYRLFNIGELETACEDFGQAVVYRGSIPGSPDRFVLDAHHDIETGRAFPVCGNTWRMLQDTRFRPHFDFVGDFSRHFGLFPGCGGSIPFSDSVARSAGACC